MVSIVERVSHRWPQLRTQVDLLRWNWRSYPARSTTLVLVRLIVAGTVIGNALLLRETVNQVIHRNTTAAAWAAAALAMMVALGLALTRVQNLLRIWLVDHLSLRQLQPGMLRDIASLPRVDHLEQPEFLDRIATLRGNGWMLMSGSWALMDTAINLLTWGILLAVLGTVSPWLLLLVGFALVPLWCDHRGQQVMSKAETERAEADRLQRHLFNLATQPESGREIRVAGAGEELIRRQKQAWDEMTAGKLRAQLWAAGWKLFGWTLFTSGFTGAIALLMYGQGNSGVGDVVLAVTVAVRLRDSIASVVSVASAAVGTRRFTEPYQWLRKYVADQSDEATGSTVPPETLRTGIRFEQVGYRYPGTDRAAVDQVSCDLPAGSVIAVVGEYGSGKTTLVKLLCGLHRPDQGRITVDGVDLADLDLGTWRARSSAAFQDFVRFQVRFGQTIALGDLPSTDPASPEPGESDPAWDPRRIEDAVLAADAEDLVARLPQGLETQLGRTFDGVELSEGQWQKTALARASMRRTPLLFVLDEPTASLDAPSEHALFTRYLAHSRNLASSTGAITVIVSHRFSTVAGADQILVMDQGRVVEAGTHEQLLAQGARYAELYGIQADAYSL